MKMSKHAKILNSV